MMEKLAGMTDVELEGVLNLIINGLPLILNHIIPISSNTNRFKPYYKWITFNTKSVVSGYLFSLSFKPYYKWITFNT